MKNDEAIIWKAVKDFEGLYEISNLGSVRRVRIDRRGKISYKYLKPETEKGRVSLYKDGECVRRTINQLMYESFGIPSLDDEVWESTEYEDIKISNFKRVYNIRTAHFLEGENVKVTKMSLNAFGLPSEEDEHWKEIEGYEGLYQISDKGRVVNVQTGKILKQRPHKGYLRIMLHKKGEVKSYFVHRLVAKAFVPNTNEEEWNQVNHRNEDKTDNRSENLEWCSAEYNNNYGSRKERAGKSQSDTYAKKRQDKLNNCETEEERDKVLKAQRLAENERRWYWKQKNQ